LVLLVGILTYYSLILCAAKQLSSAQFKEFMLLRSLSVSTVLKSSLLAEFDLLSLLFPQVVIVMMVMIILSAVWIMIHGFGNGICIVMLLSVARRFRCTINIASSCLSIGLVLFVVIPTASNGTQNSSGSFVFSRSVAGRVITAVVWIMIPGFGNGICIVMLLSVAHIFGCTINTAGSCLDTGLVQLVGILLLDVYAASTT
nr:hypothetical protein [Tanacetum cinerariifolium]